MLCAPGEDGSEGELLPLIKYYRTDAARIDSLRQKVLFE